MFVGGVTALVGSISSISNENLIKKGGFLTDTHRMSICLFSRDVIFYEEFSKL